MNDATTTVNPPRDGLFSSMRGLLATFLDLFHTRLELLTTELEEEKQRFLKVVAWGAVALMFGGMAFLFASIFVVVLFWEEHRMLAVGGVVAVFLVACMAAAARVIVHWRASTALLATTLAELKQDQQALMSSLSRSDKA